MVLLVYKFDAILKTQLLLMRFVQLGTTIISVQFSINTSKK